MMSESQNPGRSVSYRSLFETIVLMTITGGIYASLLIVGWAWIDPGNGYDFVTDRQTATVWFALVLPVMLCILFVVFMLSWGLGGALVNRFAPPDGEKRSVTSRMNASVDAIGCATAIFLMMFALKFAGMPSYASLTILAYVTAIVLCTYFSVTGYQRLFR